MGLSLAKARKDLRNKEKSEVTITGTIPRSVVAWSYFDVSLIDVSFALLLFVTGCRYNGRAWAKFCKHFSTALHLHKLNVIGHHHKQEFQMSTEGAKVLCNALVHNDELSDLTLMWNNLGNKGCNIIANAVTINQLNWSFPFSLNLAYNTIGEEGATILANALRTNHLITKLDLKGNNIYCAGASALAASLKFNTILEELNLQCNGISDRGAIEIADTLAVNNVIKTLDLWGNPVRHRGAMALAEGIVQSMPDVCLDYMRVDEFWLPIKPLLGVEVKRSLDLRESCLGVLDAIIIAIFMKENKEVCCEQHVCARVCAF